MRNVLVIFASIILYTGAGLFAQERENIEQVGRIYNCWESHRGDIEVNDSLAVLATGRSGIQILDISDPVNPVIVGYYDDNRGETKYLATNDSYVYIPEDGGVGIIDISDPANPERISFIPGRDGFIQMGIAVNNDHVYSISKIGNGFYLRVIDVSDPQNSFEVGDCLIRDPSGNLSLVVKDDYAFIEGAGMHIFDLTDPEHPVEIGYYEELRYYRAVIHNDYLITMNRGRDNGVLVVIDVSDPTNPEVVGDHWCVQPEDIAVNGEYVYLITEGSLLQIYDISNIQNPTRVVQFQTSMQGSRISVHDDIACLITIDTNGNFVGSSIIDISNPDNPDEISNITSDGYISDVVVADDLAYIASGYSGFRIVDISDLTNPIQISSVEVEGGRYAAKILVTDELAFVSMVRRSDGIIIYDISNIEEPVELGEINFWIVNHFIDNFEIIEHYIIFPNYSHGLFIIDFSDPAHPFLSNQYYGASAADNVCMFGNYACTISFDGHSLSITDLSDPEEPITIGEYSGDNFRPSNLCVYDSLAYVVNNVYRSYTLHSTNIRVIDVSNPEAPEEVGSFEVPKSTHSIEVINNHAYLAQTNNRIYIMNIENLDSPYFIGHYDTPGEAHDFMIEGSVLHVADHTNYSIYDCSQALVTPEDSFILHPTNFVLHPPFPNPFNSTTTIEFALPFASQVILSLYNLSGQRVETLVSGRHHAGLHRVTLNAYNTPSGLYFVKLESSGQLLTRKIMLVK